MKTIWLLKDTTNDKLNTDRTTQIKSILRLCGYIVRVVDNDILIEDLAGAVRTGDVFFATFWDERLLSVKGFLESGVAALIKKRIKEWNTTADKASIPVPEVKLAALIPWSVERKNDKNAETLAFEEEFLKALDLAMVRCESDKSQILERHKKFEGDDLFVVGGNEIVTGTIYAQPPVSWEARTDRILFPYPKTDAYGYPMLVSVVEQYNIRFQFEPVEIVAIDGRVENRDQYLEELSKSKVVFSGRTVGWPTELIEASYLGVYPFVVNEGVLSEVISDAYRFKTVQQGVNVLRSLMTNETAMKAFDLVKFAEIDSRLKVL